MSGQLTFDWTRAEQLGLLERAVLPRRPGVSAGAMKSVLKAIDGFGRGREAWPSYETLAVSAGLSVRTAKRAVRELVELSLLCVERRGALTVNHYRIVWSELAVLCQQRSATATERSATVAERSAMVALTKCHGGTLNDNEKTIETTTTEEQPQVVVVLNCGVARARQAIARAKQLGMSDCDIAERVEAWKRLPAEQMRPGVLYNWLTMTGSYQGAEVAEQPQLRLARLKSNADAIRRAELIRYGRKQGWSAAVLQRAVQRFEAEVLSNERAYYVDECIKRHQVGVG
jgi:DNA-binding transcriptional regulator YhcF (GntR family)